MTSLNIAPLPLPDVVYRIQNVDWKSYISMPGYSINAEMRVFSDSTAQQWLFIETALGSQKYYLQNADQTDQYLGRSYTSVNIVAIASRTEWTVNYKDDSYFISDSGADWITADRTLLVTASATKTVYDNQKWNLIPVVPSVVVNNPLPTGYYRIRSFDGRNLLTLLDGESVGNSSVYIKGQELSNPYQKWSVTQQGDGLYVIQNSGDSLDYIGCNPPNVKGVRVTALSSPFKWSIQNLGSGWMITLPPAIPKPISPLSIGFPGYLAESNTDVDLQASDDTPSQLWFFEKFIPIGNEEVHAERLVAEGQYAFQCCHDVTTYMTAKEIPFRIVSGTSSPTKFKLTYLNKNSAKFQLSWTTSGKKTVYVTNRGGYLSLATKATTFVLLCEQKEDPGYYLCEPDAGYPRKIVSNRIITDVDKNKVFAIDNMSDSNPMQMWTLDPEE